MSHSSRLPARSRPPVRLDATDRFLRMFFVRAAQRAALSVLAASVLSACGGPLYADVGSGELGDDPPDGRERWTAVPCSPQGAFELGLHDIELSQDVDYVALKRSSWERTTDEEHGEPCKTANDFGTCKDLLSTIDAHLTYSDDGCFESSCGTPYAVTTRGDEVALWPGPDGVRELLGAIDTPRKAVLWLFTQGLYNHSCGELERGAYRETEDGIEVRTLESKGGCPVEYSHVTRLVEVDGSVSITNEEEVPNDQRECVAAGRRPQGLVAQTGAEAHSALGRYFAKMAHLEAASVHAFETLEAELEGLGAPLRLREKVREAIVDEREHTGAVAALAQRFGATPPPVELAPHALRDAFALALDNAVEGCVRETFGAALATYQALHARDLAVRTTMAAIAEDETRHAGLSWQLSAWLDGQLSAAERACVRAAQVAALAELRKELSVPPERELVAFAGVPERTTALLLLQELEHGLLGPALAA